MERRSVRIRRDRDSGRVVIRRREIDVKKVRESRNILYLIRLCEIYLGGEASEEAFRELFNYYLERVKQDVDGVGEDRINMIRSIVGKFRDRGMYEYEYKLSSLLGEKVKEVGGDG
ncbi:MAG: hypothetical protein QXP57_08475 [Nitrososphaerota archaeon]